MFKIGNDLIEAYVGHYEDEWMAELYEEVGGQNVEEDAHEAWMKARATREIINHTPKRRLEIYLEWNGILGYGSRIFEVATGHL